MLYGGLMILIAFICIAMMWTEGLWGNALTFVNVLFASLIAVNFFEPMASFLEPKIPSFTYFIDFVSVWLIFVVALAIFSITTDQLSTTLVRFKMPVEQAGRAIFALATAWVFVCFVTFTMHMAPLSRSSFRGSFQDEPLSKNVFGSAPDRMFLGYVHSSSGGALSNPQPRVFDKEGEFVLKYGARRQSLKLHNVKEGKSRVGN